MKYKVGDKVRVREDLELNNVYSMIGSKGKNAFVSGMMKYRGRVLTIRSLAGGQYKTFEDPLYSWTDEMFEGTHAEPKIVITSDGQTVTAKKYAGKKVVNTATATCSPRDTYNFDTGAKLAMQRMLGGVASVPVQTPKFEVGDIVRVKEKTGRIRHNFDVGTIAKVRIVDDDDSVFCYSGGHMQWVKFQDLEKIEF